VTYHELKSALGVPPEDSAAVASRVRAARDAQHDRLARFGVHLNSDIPGALLRKTLAPDRAAVHSLKKAMDNHTLTARGYIRVLRIAWTLADLAGAGSPTSDHVQLALFFKTTVTS
jgi:magnesium chelatase family protein